MNTDGQKNTLESININLNNINMDNNTYATSTLTNTIEKIYCEPQPVTAGTVVSSHGLNLTHEQVNLLKSVVEHLTETSTMLSQDNRPAVLASLSTHLAEEIRLKFDIK